MNTYLIFVCLSGFLGSVLTFPQPKYNLQQGNSGNVKHAIGSNAGKAFAPINYCKVWDGSKISTSNPPICNDQLVNDTSLFPTCWTVQWNKKESKMLQKGTEAQCSCAGGQGEVNLKCGGDKQWYLADPSQLHLCGQYDQRCRANNCPELKNHEFYKCNVDTAGNIGENRNCICKNTCRSVNLRCEKNEYNIADWISDVDCNEFEYEVPEKHLHISIEEGGISYSCFTGFELKGQNFAKCSNGNIEHADSPVCLPVIQTTENIKSIWNNNDGRTATQVPTIGQGNSNLDPHSNHNNNHNNRPINSPTPRPFFTPKPSRDENKHGNNYNHASLNKEKSDSKVTQGILIGIIVFLIIIIAILCIFIFLKLRANKKNKQELKINGTENDSKNTKGVKTVENKECMKSNDLYVSSDTVKSSVKQ